MRNIVSTQNVISFFRIQNIKNGDIIFNGDKIFVAMDMHEDFTPADIFNLVEENKKLKQMLKEYEL